LTDRTQLLYNLKGTHNSIMQVSNGDRAYLKKAGLFGDVQRTTMLNLPNSPVLLRDDGLLVGYVGDDTHDIVNKTTASDGLTSVDVPLDVRVIGIQLLTQHGTSEEVQAKMFTKFVSLPKSERDTFVAAFEAVDQSNVAEVNAFLDNMVAGLTA
jgi:hypothetical protein